MCEANAAAAAAAACATPSRRDPDLCTERHCTASRQVAAILNVTGGDAQTDKKTVASEKKTQKKTPACHVSSPVHLPQLLFHLIPTQFCLYSGGNLVF